MQAQVGDTGHLLLLTMDHSNSTVIRLSAGLHEMRPQGRGPRPIPEARSGRPGADGDRGAF